MKPWLATIKSQLLSILSVFIAISALSYNSWRNEVTEKNRNIRAAGFEMIKQLAELQVLTDHMTYDQDKARNDPIKGWSIVLALEDLGSFVSDDTQHKTGNLKSTWAKEIGNIASASGEEANKAISHQIFALRDSVRRSLRALM